MVNNQIMSLAAASKSVSAVLVERCEDDLIEENNALRQERVELQTLLRNMDDQLAILSGFLCLMMSRLRNTGT